MSLVARRAATAVGALVVLVLLALAWLVVRGLRAEHALEAARSDLHAMAAAMAGGDTGRARHAAEAARADAARARTLTHDPVWWLASLPPRAGNTPRAVRTVSATVDELTRRVLPPALGAAADLAPKVLRRHGDRIDVDRIVHARPALDEVQAGMVAARGRVRSVDRSWTPRSLSSAVADLDSQLDGAVRAVATLRQVARLAPPMLGGDRPRHYFVAFQNSAEARGTGGLLGMFALLTVDRGRLHIDRLGSNTSLVSAPELPVDLGPDFRARWGDNPALWANSNMDPSFPYAARLWMALWERQAHQRLDGALATDPVALSYVLRATGPVRLSGGDTVSATNAVRLTMSDVYARYPGDNTVRDAYMRSVAQGIIGTLLSGRGDPGTLVTALTRAAGERRLLLYSAHPEEEREIARTALGGTLPGGDGPYAYVVVNNAAGSKMDYYLRRSVDYRSTGCPDGRRRSRIRITFGNAAPPPATLPEYVTQRQDTNSETRRQSPSRGSIALLVSVYGPRHAQALVVTLDGQPLGISVSSEDGRPEWGFPLAVAPGRQRTVILDVTEPPSDAGPVVPVQPLVLPQHNTVSVARCRHR